jgi:hypothetical protein
VSPCATASGSGTPTPAFNRRFWRAAAELDLPLIHHTVAWVAPYFPGYRSEIPVRFFGEP